MERKISKALENWMNNYSSMPLMLLGARQVGKTYSLSEFCEQNFEDFIYINLAQDKEIYDVFEETSNPKVILDTISILKDRVFDVDKSVFFIDEIQVSESAIQSLKYFNEADEPYKIVCAGSLLGVALNRFTKSFPVGKVYRLYMYPMDFEEFLWGTGEKTLADKIRESYFNNRKMIDALHKKLLQRYKEYLYVGGMPASIKEFVDKDCILSTYNDVIKQSILDDYLADMSKYTSASEHLKISKAYKSIPKQLGRDSNKFSYKLVDEKANKRAFETAFDWLNQSFITLKCTLVDFPEIPLKAYEKENFFKIYLNDVGLLSSLAEISKKDIISDEMRLFSGMLTENYVASAFAHNKRTLHYWKSKHSAEIDFLINIDGHVIPVEVKASVNTKSKSLNSYMDKYKPSYAIRLSSKNFGMTNKIKSVPLYAAHLITER